MPSEAIKKGFQQHGVSISGDKENDTQFVGGCPICNDQRDRFYISKENYLWDCKICGRSGNFQKFLNYIAEENIKRITPELTMKLAKDRGLKPQTLRAWRIGWSGSFYTWPSNGNPGASVTDLRRYTLGKRILATSGAKVSLIRAKKVYDSKRIWLMEGDWDGMAMYECLQSLGVEEDVYSSAGAGMLPKRVLDLFEGKDIMVVYDNDEAGTGGMSRVSDLLGGIADSLSFVRWPLDLDNGFDFRDLYLSKGKDAQDTMEILETLLKDSFEDIVPSPRESGPKGKGLDYKDVLKAFKKWLHLSSTEPIEVIFGSVFANRLGGDPLWLFLVAPPGSMKSELLMSLAGGPLIHTVSSITPHALISGSNTHGGRDPSLIPRLDGKCLVIKDFTAILELNPLDRNEIFGVLRDAYDGFTEKHFGNGVVRSYRSNFGLIAGVTTKIESFAEYSSSLGERFLKYRIIMDEPTKAVSRALENVNQSEQMRKELNEIACQTLDYKLDYLPELKQEHKDKIIMLAEWCSLMRGVVSRNRYTGEVLFKPMTEVGTRLAKQLTKLALGISIFKREKKVSNESFEAVLATALSTLPDRIEEIVKQLYLHDGRGRVPEIAEWSRFPVSTVRRVLKDLAMLNIIEYQGQIRVLNGNIEKVLLTLGIYEKRKIKRKVKRRLKNV